MRMGGNQRSYMEFTGGLVLRQHICRKLRVVEEFHTACTVLFGINFFFYDLFLLGRGETMYQIKQQGMWKIV